MTRRRRWILYGLLVGVVGAAAFLASTSQGRALVRPTWGFASLESDPRVRFEASARENAERVASVLDRTLARVETIHGSTLPSAPGIFVCGTQESFNAFLAEPGGRTTGAVLLGRLMLSPRSFNEGTYEEVLGHELSHLLLRRRRGWVAAVTEIPRWFHEGLAVYASGGGGALPVSKKAARRAIVAGRTFTPEDEGAWRPRGPAAHGMPHHLFYRESGMFVEFLAERDAAGFRSFVIALHRGEGFREAFEGRLGQTVAAAWSEFVASVRDTAA
jgi:hypothetical protein